MFHPPRACDLDRRACGGTIRSFEKEQMVTPFRVEPAERVATSTPGVPGTASNAHGARFEPHEEGRFLTPRRVAEWSLLPLAFVILRFVPERLTRPSDWLLLLAAAALFASPVVFSSHREFVKGRHARSAELLAVEYRARLGLTLGEAITPIADLLGRIAVKDGEERAGLQGQLRQRVVDAASALTSAERSRSVFFGLEGRKLRAVAWSGRPEPPNQALARSGVSGALAYHLVESHGRVLVTDVSEPEAAPLDLDGRYGTFLAVGVYAASTNLGLLTVDAAEPGALEESDLDIVAALAQTLGAGLAL